jgi:hypothetical protein
MSLIARMRNVRPGRVMNVSPTCQFGTPLLSVGGSAGVPSRVLELEGESHRPCPVAVGTRAPQRGPVDMRPTNERPFAHEGSAGGVRRFRGSRVGRGDTCCRACSRAAPRECRLRREWRRGEPHRCAPACRRCCASRWSSGVPRPGCRGEGDRLESGWVAVRLRRQGWPDLRRVGLVASTPFARVS